MLEFIVSGGRVFVRSITRVWVVADRDTRTFGVAIVLKIKKNTYKLPLRHSIFLSYLVAIGEDMPEKRKSYPREVHELQ